MLRSQLPVARYARLRRLSPPSLAALPPYSVGGDSGTRFKSVAARVSISIIDSYQSKLALSANPSSNEQIVISSKKQAFDENIAQTSL